MNAQQARTIFGASFLVAATALPWLGCTTEVAPTNGLVEKTEVSPQATGTGPQSIYPPVPSCNGPQQYIYAYVHEQPDAPGEVSAYTDSVPAPLELVGATVQAYETEVFEQVPQANEYEYRATWFQDGKTYLAIGINDADTLPAYSTVPPAHNALKGSPGVVDWDAEWNLASRNGGAPISAQVLTCVEVVAYDGPQAGQTLDFFPVVDLHDPNVPNW